MILLVHLLTMNHHRHANMKKWHPKIQSHHDFRSTDAKTLFSTDLLRTLPYLVTQMTKYFITLLAWRLLINHYYCNNPIKFWNSSHYRKQSASSAVLRQDAIPTISNYISSQFISVWFAAGFWWYLLVFVKQRKVR